MPRESLTQNEAWLKGTKSKAQPHAESGFESGRPKQPKHLTPVAAQKWKELVRVLNKRGTLTKADAELLELVCEQYARWRLYVEDIQKRGLYIKESYTDKYGNEDEREIPNQSAKFANQLENTLARNLVQLGITPASRERAKPAAPPAPPKDTIIPGSRRDIERKLAKWAENPDWVDPDEETE